MNDWAVTQTAPAGRPASVRLRPLRLADHCCVKRAIAEGAFGGALEARLRPRGDPAVALDEPVGRAAFELNVDELRGDLEGRVEAQGIGADQEGLALLQFLIRK